MPKLHGRIEDGVDVRHFGSWRGKKTREDEVESDISYCNIVSRGCIGLTTVVTV
jgi:hypothetical protein